MRETLVLIKKGENFCILIKIGAKSLYQNLRFYSLRFASFISVCVRRVSKKKKMIYLKIVIFIVTATLSAASATGNNDISKVICEIPQSIKANSDCRDFCNRYNYANGECDSEPSRCQCTSTVSYDGEF